MHCCIAACAFLHRGNLINNVNEEFYSPSLVCSIYFVLLMCVFFLIYSGFNRCFDSSYDAGDAWKVCHLSFTSCVRLMLMFLGHTPRTFAKTFSTNWMPEGYWPLWCFCPLLSLSEFDTWTHINSDWTMHSSATHKLRQLDMNGHEGCWNPFKWENVYFWLVIILWNNNSIIT